MFLSKLQRLLTPLTASAVEDDPVVVRRTWEGKIPLEVSSITGEGFLKLRERHVDRGRDDSLCHLVGFADVDDGDLARRGGGFGFEFRVLDGAAGLPACVFGVGDAGGGEVAGAVERGRLSDGRGEAEGGSGGEDGEGGNGGDCRGGTKWTQSADESSC